MIKIFQMKLTDKEEKEILAYLLPKSKTLDTPEMTLLEGILLRVWQGYQHGVEVTETTAVMESQSPR